MPTAPGGEVTGTLFAVLWIVIIGVVAALYAMRPRTTRLGLGVGMVVFTALGLLRFFMYWYSQQAIASAFGEPTPFPWADLLYLSFVFAAAGIGVLVGSRLKRQGSRSDPARLQKSANLAVVGSADTLTEAMPALVAYFELDPEGIASAAPALVSLRSTDESLASATQASLCERLVSARIDVEIAVQVAAVLSAR